MRKVVRWMLCVFVFTQPWDTIAWEGIGALSRVVGIVTLGAALITVGLQGRVRRPGAIFWLASVFVASSAVSLLWTVSTALSTQRVSTYVQLLGSVWVVQEFARTKEQHQSLLVAYCLGAFIPIASMLNSFRIGVRIGEFTERYSSDGVLYNNANNLALILVIAIPMALYLMRHRGGIIRVMACTYMVLGPLAILLTGTRTTFLAGIVALSIAPFTQLRQSLRSFFRARVLFRASAMAVVVTAALVLVVPQAIWARLSTIPSEITEGGSMNGRAEIWNAGLQMIRERPFLGVGAGAFEEGVAPLIGGTAAAHNLLLDILGEQGIIGLSLYVALLGACAIVISRLPSAERELWAAVMISWFVGVMAINFGVTKATWLLFGLLAAQSTAKTRHAKFENANEAALTPVAI